MKRYAVKVLAAGAVWAAAVPAMAAPLLLVQGDDTSVVVLDLAGRTNVGDRRMGTLYRGAISQGGGDPGGMVQTVTGERREFDCVRRRERQVAVLSRGAGGKTVETPVEGEWSDIAWKSAMDYAETAVCLNIYDRDKVSTKSDVPSILAALEEVWKPGHFQPPPERRVEQPRRPWWRPSL